MGTIDWKRGTSVHIECTVYIHVVQSNRNEQPIKLSNIEISMLLKETNHVAAKLPSGVSMFIKVSYCTNEKSICWIFVELIIFIRYNKSSIVNLSIILIIDKTKI